MSLYPSEEWLTEYGRILDESDALDDLALGWGERFDGDIRIVISELPLAETRLDDLPEEVLEEVPEALRGGIGDVSLADLPSMLDAPVRESLPAGPRNLVEQIEEYVIDGSIYAHVDLERGDCAGVEVLSDPEARDAGFVIRGPYDTWRQVVDGRPAIGALVGGDLRIEGNALRQLRYTAMFQLLGDLAAEVETTHVFEGPDSTPGATLVDEAVRQPAFIHRTAERQLSRTLNLF